MQFIYKFEAMTTPCEVSLFCDEKTKADNIARMILQEAKRLEKKYNYFSQDSYLSALNQRVRDDLDPETKNLLQRALQYDKRTNHVFDITIATIKDIYKSATSLEQLHDERAKLLPFTGCEHIAIKKNRLFFDNPYTKIDLGGFVKEYAVDRAIKIIQKAKLKTALVNFGGDIYALGKKPNGQRFKVGIKDPKDPKTFIHYEEIENQALTTSASYERNCTIEGKLFSHILSKKEIQNNPLSVTVIANSCVESGVFSTALMIDPTIETKNRVVML